MRWNMRWNPYCGVAPTPAELIGRWNLDPWLLAALLALALGYAAASRGFAPQE